MPNINEVDRKNFYESYTTPLERRAYQAAHKILEADFRVSHLACRGERKSRTIDAIAEIIMQACEPGGQDVEPKLQKLLMGRRVG